jgi:hypothetical protein
MRIYPVKKKRKLVYTDSSGNIKELECKPYKAGKLKSPNFILRLFMRRK